MTTYPVSIEQIQASYEIVKTTEDKTHSEAVLVLFAFYDASFGLTSYKFKRYVMDALDQLNNPVDAFDRAMNIIT